MQKIFAKSLVYAALFASSSLVSAEGGVTYFDGPCPTFKPFDFDISKLSGKTFHLLYG